MKMYCQKCGSGTSYNMEKPRFCQNCGSSFAGESEASKASKVIKKTVTKKMHNPVTAAPLVEDDDVSVPDNINKLEFDVVGSLEVKGTTVANLAGTLSPNEKIGEKKQSGPQIDKEEFLQNFQKEAGTSRPK